MSGHVLISPLGFSPGAVSGVYFALEKKEVKVDEIITVGTAHQGVRDAAAILADLFRRVEGVTYKPRYIDAEELRGDERDASGPFAARMGLYVQRAREAKKTVHVAVTGGRSGMGALAALAAQVYRADHLYHLWVSEEIERGGSDPARVRPSEPENRYLNPTVVEGAWSLVSLPFLDLSDLIQDAEKYRKSGQVPQGWTAGRLVGEGPAMLTALSRYVPAGLTIAMAQEVLQLTAEWRENVEWIAKDDPTRVVRVGKIDRARQEAIWHRLLSILYTAGALDDESRESLRRLMGESIADDYARSKLEAAAKKDEVGILRSLEKHKDAITAICTVGTLVFQIVELALKAAQVIH
ncbi:MAG: CRISPR-associated ring nuclease [Anaerolineae bacterium]